MLNAHPCCVHFCILSCRRTPGVPGRGGVFLFSSLFCKHTALSGQAALCLMARDHARCLPSCTVATAPLAPLLKSLSSRWPLRARSRCTVLPAGPGVACARCAPVRPAPLSLGAPLPIGEYWTATLSAAANPQTAVVLCQRACRAGPLWLPPCSPCWCPSMPGCVTAAEGCTPSLPCCPWLLPSPSPLPASRPLARAASPCAAARPRRAPHLRRCMA